MDGDLYSRLGVTESATREEIGKAYRRLARTEHPDKGGDVDTWHAIAEAYAVLSDEEKRARYDVTGEIPQRGPSIEDEARSVLMAGFAEMVRTGLLGSGLDVAKHLRKGVGKLRQVSLKTITQHEVVKKRLSAQLGRLKGAEAVFFENYLKEQITSADQVITEEKHGVEIAVKALSMIEDLEDLFASPETDDPVRISLGSMKYSFKFNDDSKW